MKIYANAEVVSALFILLDDSRDRCNHCDPVGIYQQNTSGTSNLMKNVNVKRPNYINLVRETLREDGGYFRLCQPSQRDKDIRAWIKRIVRRHLPLSIVDDKETRDSVKLTTICSDTLKSYIVAAAAEVRKTLQTSHPDQFALVFDGRSNAGRHYVAIFAVYDSSNAAADVDGFLTDGQVLRAPHRTYALLAFCPLDRENDLSAQSYTLSAYNRP